MTGGSRTTVVFARHWRREVADIADTLRAAIAADGSTVRVLGGSRLPSRADLARRADVLVVSDDQDIGPGTLRRLGDPTVLRLWWNAADEVIRHAEDHPGPEVPVCFFADVSAEARAAGVDVVHVPYAFSTPTPPVASLVPAVGYTGEVDITDACFEGVPGTPPSSLGDRARAAAAEVVAGRRTLVDTDAEIRGDVDLGADLSRTMLWAVRNHVRHALLRAVADAFPAQVAIRGDDWTKVGFDAAPTNFKRSLRTDDYRRHRVSLDLGSKSTNDALYPRSVDIMAVGGGLAQLHTGEPTPEVLGAMDARRVRSADALVALVGGQLEAPEAEVAAERARIHAEYVGARLASGRLLLDAIAQRRG